jgi:hypothetical protein
VIFLGLAVRKFRNLLLALWIGAMGDWVLLTSLKAGFSKYLSPSNRFSTVSSEATWTMGDVDVIGMLVVQGVLAAAVFACIMVASRKILRKAGLAESLS